LGGAQYLSQRLPPAQTPDESSGLWTFRFPPRWEYSTNSGSLPGNLIDVSGPFEGAVPGQQSRYSLRINSADAACPLTTRIMFSPLPSPRGRFLPLIVI